MIILNRCILYETKKEIRCISIGTILYYILQINIGFQRIENVEENVS